MCLPLADWGESHRVQKKNTNIPKRYLAVCQSHYKQITVKWKSSGGCVVSWEEAEKEYQGFGRGSIFQLLTFRFYLVVLMPLVDNLFVKTSGLETEWPGRFCQRLRWRKLWFLGNRMREGAVWVTQASTSPACSFRSHIFEYNGRDSGFILRLLSVLSIRSLSLSLTFPRANTCSDLITFPSSWNQAPRCPEDLWLCPESLVVDRPRVPRPPIPSSFIARPHEGKRCPMVQGLSWWHRRRQRALSPSRSSSQVTLWSYISPGLSGKLVLYFPSRGHLTGFQRTSSVCERFGLLSDPILLRSLPPSLPSVIQRFLSKALKWPPVRTSWYILIWGPRCPGVSLGDQGEKKIHFFSHIYPICRWWKIHGHSQTSGNGF